MHGAPKEVYTLKKWSHLYIEISSYYLTSPPYMCLYMNHAARALQSHDLSGEGIDFGSHTYFFSTTQGQGGPPRMRDHLNSGATCETTRTLKTIHIIHSLILTRWIRYGWLWWPNDIRGPCGPKVCLTGEEKPEKTSPRKLVPTGDLTRARCVHEHMLPPAPQRWTYIYIYIYIYLYIERER